MKYKKWIRWFDVINHDILILQISNQCNADLNSFQISQQNNFYKFLQLWYSNYMVIGIRRQIKVNRESVSFMGLLNEMQTMPRTITRTRYLTLYEDKTKGNAIYDKFGGSGKEYLDDVKILDDLRELKEVSSKCESFADRLIAHLDRRGLPTTKLPSYKELKKALIHLAKLREKYAELFYGDQTRTNIISFRPPEFKNDINSFFRRAVGE